MRRTRVALGFVVAAAAIAVPPAQGADRGHDPLRFFEGKTESVSTVKVLMKKSYETRAIGTGRIKSDGSLDLVQRVERDGHPTTIRRWAIRQTGPGRYSGTMSEAVGPVSIEEMKGAYRFRFKMKGNLAVEQWLTPQDGWRSAKNDLTVRRFGIKVGSSHGVIRKIS